MICSLRNHRKLLRKYSLWHDVQGTPCGMDFHARFPHRKNDERCAQWLWLDLNWVSNKSFATADPMKMVRLKLLNSDLANVKCFSLDVLALIWVRMDI